MSLYSTLPDTFAGTLIAFPLFLATKARPIFAKLSSRKNQLGIPVSGQLPTYPSPNPTLTLTCYQLTVGNIGARKKNFSETILAAMIDEWTVFWRAPEEKQNDRAMITLYQLRTNANLGLTNQYDCLWCSSAWSQRVLKGTFRLLDPSLRLLSLLNHTNILFLSMWVSELIEINFDLL